MHSVTIWFLIHENISACCWAECKAWVLHPSLCRCPSAAQRQQLKDGGWWGCVWPLPWQWINAVCVEQSRSCCSGAGAHTCSMLPPAALWGLHHMHSMHHQPSLGSPSKAAVQCSSSSLVGPEGAAFGSWTRRRSCWDGCPGNLNPVTDVNNALLQCRNKGVGR